MAWSWLALLGAAIDPAMLTAMDSLAMLLRLRKFGNSSPAMTEIRHYTSAPLAPSADGRTDDFPYMLMEHIEDDGSGEVRSVQGVTAQG